MEIEDEIANKLNDKCYGPKYCHHCKCVRNIQTFVLQGSEKISYENNTVTRSFIGSQVCDFCKHAINGEGK